MQKLVDWWKSVVQWAAVKGIPVPLIRNPINQQPSVSLTMLLATYVLCLLALIGKVASSKYFESINFANSFELFVACSALYFGRNFQKGTVSINVQKETQPEKKT